MADKNPADKSPADKSPANKAAMDQLVNTLVTGTVKLLVNDLADRYAEYKRGELEEGRKPIEAKEYWKKHLKITGFETVDTWLQKQVRKAIDDEIRDAKRIVSNAREFASTVKGWIGF